MLLFDAHLDLAMNAMEWNRDLRQPVAALRLRERGLYDKPGRGRGTVSFPAMRRGGIGLCVATQIARYVRPGSLLPGWHSPEQAWAQTQAQRAWYGEMEAAGELVAITDLAGLEAQRQRWETPDLDAPIGYILSLEGADSLVDLSYLERAYAYGLRALGPAHYGPGVYAPGTGSQGGLTRPGRELLREMDRLGMILDVTHLTDEGFWEALKLYKGPIWASHSNCRALVPDQRQQSDEQIMALLEREAVIGVAFDAWMLHPGWIRGETTPEATGLSLEQVADQIDHICQLAGDARHVGIGSDLDGGFGTEQGPMDVDTIADLQGLLPLLRDRGYPEADLAGIFHGNWLSFLRRAWA